MPKMTCNSSSDMSLALKLRIATGKLIKAMRVKTFILSVIRHFVLNHKRIFIKSDSAIIISSKLVNRERIRFNLRNMKDMFEFKRMMRCRENTKTSVHDRKSVSIAHGNLIKSLIRMIEFEVV